MDIQLKQQAFTIKNTASCYLSHRDSVIHTMKSKYILLLSLLLISLVCHAQRGASDDFSIEISKIYPPVSMKADTISQAKTIADIYPYHKPERISEYRAVEIMAKMKGEEKLATGIDDVLTLEQIELIKNADTGSPIHVSIKYIPRNDLKHNDVQTDDFVLTIDPDNDAVYPGGTTALTAYLESIIAEVGKDKYQGYDLSTIKFTVNEEGGVEGAHIFWPSHLETIDQQLLKSICNMPSWTPATYADGTTVSQEYVLTVGNTKNCVVNMLNTKK